MMSRMLSGLNRSVRGIACVGIALVVAMTVASSAQAQSAVVPPGAGTSAADPYRISQLGHLVWMGNNAGSSGGKYYTMQNDIDASATAGWNSGAGFAPIPLFSGIFNGSGNVIGNLTINRPTQTYVGLFGYVSSGGVVKNLGLVGGSVMGDHSVGNLVGYNYGGTVSNCSSTGAVSGNGELGGLVGNNDYGGTVSECYATGVVKAKHGYAGGLVGYNYHSTVSRCYAMGSVTGRLGNCVGGLAGDNSGTISECYATGAVSGPYGSGGLAGNNYGTISECYSSGAVKTGGQGSGGFVGVWSGGGAVINSYWDTQTSGRTTSPGGGTGKTTAQMKQQATFVGWDFTSVWSITENVTYPHLVWHPSVSSRAPVSANRNGIYLSNNWIDKGLNSVHPGYGGQVSAFLRELSANELFELYPNCGGAGPDGHLLPWTSALPFCTAVQQFNGNLGGVNPSGASLYLYCWLSINTRNTDVTKATVMNNFISDVSTLLGNNPSFAGVTLDIEPFPDRSYDQTKYNAIMTLIEQLAASCTLGPANNGKEFHLYVNHVDTQVNYDEVWSISTFQQVANSGLFDKLMWANYDNNPDATSTWLPTLLGAGLPSGVRIAVGLGIFDHLPGNSARRATFGSTLLRVKPYRGYAAFGGNVLYIDEDGEGTLPRYLNSEIWNTWETDWLDWDSGYEDIGNGWRRLSWFGDYAPLGFNWIYHNEHGYMYCTPSSTRQSIFFYTMDMGWLWTKSSMYPYLYQFSDRAWLWYLKGSKNPRWFNNLTTGQWESH